MEDNVIGYLLGFAFGCLILYFIIKIAVASANENLVSEQRVQNRLLRKSLGIDSSTQEELHKNYEEGFYSYKQYQLIKKSGKK